ncbi:MAG: ComEA family DNA-binding protein [Bacteroides sp.]
MIRRLRLLLRYSLYERKCIVIMICAVALTTGAGRWWKQHHALPLADERSDSLMSRFDDSLRSGKSYAAIPNPAKSRETLTDEEQYARRSARKQASKNPLRPKKQRPSGQAERHTFAQKERRKAWSDSAREEPPSVYLPRKDTLYTRVEKYPKGTRIELNRCDTSELKKIPGIGSYTARRIVEYRTKLGGFARLEQLREIRLNNEVLEPWLTLDSTAITPLHINRLAMKQLLAHPYLNYRQSTAIMRYRKLHGAIPSLQVMQGWEEFTANELKRLTPYLSFD